MAGEPHLTHNEIFSYSISMSTNKTTILQFIRNIINAIFRVIDYFTGIYYYLFQLTPPSTKLPNALILTCVDWRFIDDYVVVLDQLHLTQDYDQFILAGSSLSFTNDPSPTGADKDLDIVTFQKAYVDHLLLLLNLHSINTIIVIDHEDCGAYKVYYGEDSKETHIRNVKTFLKKIRRVLKDKHECNFEYIGYYITLDAKLEQVARYQ
jgi:hypothetical protein